MRIAVVGGGIAGLAAAWEAVINGHDVTVLESADRVGGKIRTSAFADRPVDEGADAFLTRVPHATALCAEIGLDDLVAPATGKAYLWAKGALRAIPEGTVLGIPSDLDPVAASGLLSPEGLARAAAEPTIAGPVMTDDTSIGELIRRRFGDEVADYLVDPLLGGINAGGIDNLSVEVAAAQIAAVARRSSSLLQGLAEMRAAAPPAGSGPPVFLAPRGGMGRLIDHLREALTDRGATITTGVTVKAIERRGDGWTVVTSNGQYDGDGVVIGAPAPVASALLRSIAPAVAMGLAAIDHASVALVTLRYPTDALATPLDGSGFLVPRPENRMLTACSWFSTKWAHLASADSLIARASVGRFGDDAALDRSDDDLVAAVDAELRLAMGLTSGPSEARVSRWVGAFPQFAPGHLQRMDEIEAGLGAVAPRVALAGSYLRGVGIPACIASGRSAVGAIAAASHPS